MSRNYIKAKIDNTPQNRKNNLCHDTDETMYHKRKCRELTEKECKK